MIFIIYHEVYHEVHHQVHHQVYHEVYMRVIMRFASRDREQEITGIEQIVFELEKTLWALLSHYNNYDKYSRCLKNKISMLIDCIPAPSPAVKKGEINFST